MFESQRGKNPTWTNKVNFTWEKEETWWCMPEHSCNNHVSEQMPYYLAEALSKLGHLQQREGRGEKYIGKKIKLKITKFSRSCSQPARRGQRRTRQDCEQLRAHCCFQLSALIVTISAYRPTAQTEGGDRKETGGLNWPIRFSPTKSLITAPSNLCVTVIY